MAEARLQREPRVDRALGLDARLAQALGHLVEALGEVADLVLALAEDRAREVAVRHLVDALDEPLERVRDRAARGEPDEEREAHETHQAAEIKE